MLWKIYVDIYATGEAQFTISPHFSGVLLLKNNSPIFVEKFCGSGEGEEGSNGAWVGYSSPLAQFVLVLLIQQAASSELLPCGISGSSISSFKPVLVSGEGHMVCPRGKLWLVHIFTFPPSVAQAVGRVCSGTGMGELSPLCPPVHPCPGSSTQGKDRAQP